MQATKAHALIQAAERFGTPVYVYDQATILDRCRSLLAAIPYPRKKLLYAVKANSNQAVVKTILGAGFGLDCVSIGEVLLGRTLGAGTILYTHNNVADAEFSAAVKMARAAKPRVWINCDSLQRLADLPRRSACFVRINGPVGGGHHDHVITGGPDSKFGIPWEQMPEALSLAAARQHRIIGVHQHIGSGIRDVAKFERAIEVLLSVVRRYRFPDLEYVNFGGGIGVPYRPTEQPMDLRAFGAMLTGRFSEFCREAGRDLTLMLEPGRFPVAEAGYLVVRANTIKETPYGKTYVGVDSGFNHLVRPTMYGSYHHITNASNPRGKTRPYYVAGYICESGDIFTRGDGDENRAAPRELPEVRRGDLLVLHNAGAYGYVMASEYNMRPRPPEVLLSGGKLVLARRAKTVGELVREALGSGR
ncbi:MAG: diaminopimelate decarboxylase [Planctomycetota bacterium]|nr:diaminopimelate decarboxylase [Planctomycetota bacterium]